MFDSVGLGNWKPFVERCLHLCQKTEFLSSSRCDFDQGKLAPCVKQTRLRLKYAMLFLTSKIEMSLIGLSMVSMNFSSVSRKTANSGIGSLTSRGY